MKNNTPDTDDHLPPETDGVKTLLGNPKRAILKLSVPIIISLSVQTIYFFVDAIWVSGLGPDALSAVGFLLPFFFMIIALASGLGVGGAAAISRRIGAHDKTGADDVATHTVVMMLIISAIITIPLLLFARSILVRMGAGRVVPLATSYAQIIFIGTTLIFWAHVANALLRAEGDVRRAMYAGMGGALLNIVLDPIFIYTLRLGVPGAAWASVISMLVSSSLLFYWVCIKRDTYISLTLRYFRFKKQIIRDILRVGLPASIMQIALAISVLFLNMIAVRAGGTDGVAVYTTAWRVRLLGVLPLFGIATAVTSVTGAAFGAHEYDKLDTAYMYAVKIGVIIELIAALVTYILAVQITSLFTIAQEATRIAGDIVISIRIICIYYPAAALGIFSSAMFQGIGKGTHSLIVTVFRTVILLTPLAYLFAITFRMQLPGIWWGMVVGNTVGATLAFIWARYTINRLKNKDRIAPSES